MVSTGRKANSSIDSVSLIGENGLLSNSEGFGFKYESYSDNVWYRDVYLGETAHWSSVREGSFAVNSLRGSRFVLLSMRIRPPAAVEPLGVVLIDIKEDTLLRSMKNRLPADSQRYLIDAYGDLICETPFAAGSGLPSYAGIRNQVTAYDTKEPVQRPSASSYLSVYSLNNGWSLVQVMHSSALKNSGFLLLTLLLVLPLIALIVFSSITQYATAFLIRRLKTLSDRAVLVESGDLTIRMDESGNDEISALAHGLNSMIEKISSLLTAIYDNQRELRKAELVALQAQINPIFSITRWTPSPG